MRWLFWFLLVPQPFLLLGWFGESGWPSVDFGAVLCLFLLLFAEPVVLPGLLLGAAVGRALIDEATKKYDQVLVDTPPLLLVSDALVVADTVDGVILVCRAKANTRGIVQRARDRLYDVNAWIIGAVLNAAQVRRGGYFREQFREYYDYQSDQPGGGAASEPPRTAVEEDDKPEPS